MRSHYDFSKGERGKYAHQYCGSDAVKILHSLYVGDDPGRLAALEEERRLADEEQAEFDRTGVDPYEE